MDKIIKIVQKHAGDTIVTLDTNLGKDLLLDSMGLVELVLDIEAEFKVDIPAEDLDNIRFVSDFITYIKGKQIT